MKKVFEVLSLSNEAVLRCRETYDYLRQRGELISDADLLIAATAVVSDATLATKDRDFEQIVDTRLKHEIKKKSNIDKHR